MNPKLNIDQDSFNLVLSILKEYLNGNFKVYAFGSRIKNRARKFSDLDLAISLTNDENVDVNLIYSLKSEFEESDLEWEVDIVDLNQITQNFKQIILKDCIQIYPVVES